MPRLVKARNAGALGRVGVWMLTAVMPALWVCGSVELTAVMPALWVCGSVELTAVMPALWVGWERGR